MHALGSARHRGAEIVFSLPAPLPAGTVIAQGPARADAPGGHGGPAVSPVRVVTRLARPAWFYYDDLAPFQQYAHRGRVALVDAATGKVSLFNVQWAPVIDGRLPAFLASQAAYDSGADRVFYRPYTAATKSSAFRVTRAGRTVTAVAARISSTGGPRVAKLISQDHACDVRFTDTVPGGYYAFARDAQSRAALAWRVTQLDRMGARLQSFLYTPASGRSPAQYVAHQIAAHGCGDVLLYLAGGGYAGQTAINIGMGLSSHNLPHQDVTVAELRSLISAHRRVHFELVIDGAHAAGFDALRRLSNVLLIATPADPPFTYLPEAKVDGRIIHNDTNPLHILQLTDRLVYGIDQVTADSGEVARMEALRQGGKLPSALAYLVARALARGSGVDFSTLTGAGAPPALVTQGFPANGPSPVPPPFGGAPAPAPVLGGIESSTLQYDAGLAGVNLTSSLTVASRDVRTLTGATVSITSGLAPGEDKLAVPAQNGITGSYNAQSGVLTLTGAASLAAYQAALRSVTFSDGNGSHPTTGPRTVSFQVGDARPQHNLSNVVSRTVQVNVAPAPVAAPDSATTGKHTAVDVKVLANDTDPDGLALHVASVDTTGTKGLVTINSDGTIHYDPNGAFDQLQSGQTATDTFTYEASDGLHNSAPATVTATITGINDPPVLAGIESSTLQYDAGAPGVPVTSTLTVTAPPGVTTLSGATVAITNGLTQSEDGLTFAAQNGITGNYNPQTGVLAMTGTASVADYQAALRTVMYADANGANPATGPRTIAFLVDDGRAPNNLSNVASRTVQVNPNPPPSAGDVPASTDKHSAIDINVLTHDSDPNGLPLHVASVNTTGTKGLVTINPDGTIHYDPNGQFESLQEGQTATDTFTYKVSNGFEESAPGTVTVTITGSNDPPVLANLESSTIQYDAGTPGVPVTSTLTATDPDDANLVGATVTISSGFIRSEDGLAAAMEDGITSTYDGQNGILTLTGSASVAAYQAVLRTVVFDDNNGASAATGPRTITFQVNDGHAANNLSNVVSRTVQVNPNSPPVAVDVPASTDKKTPIDINVLSSASDPDGDPLTVASVDTTNTKGTVSINPDGTIHYDPNGQFANLQQGQTATDTFSYKVSDGYHDSNSATVTVTITGINDPPVLANIETSTLQYAAGTPAVPVTSTLTVTDPPGVTTIAGATVAITNGFVSGGEDELTFSAQNGITGSFNPQTGVLAMTGTASVADYQAALRSVTYADTNGANPSTAPRTVAFLVDDGRSPNNLSNVAARTVQVNPAPPPVAINDSASTDKHTAVDINVLANDSDPSGLPLHVDPASIDTASTKGTVSLNGDGTIHYDPNGQFASLPQGQTATDTFTYQASDGIHDSSPATVTITITGVNDAPVLSGIESTQLTYRAQDPPVPVTQTLTISDDDATTLSGATAIISAGLNAGADQLGFINQNGITGSYNASTGVLTLNGQASLADYQAALQSIQFSTSDGSASPAQRTVTFSVTDTPGATSAPVSRQIDVTPAPQPPTVNSDSYSAVGNTPLAVGTSVSGPAVTLAGGSVLSNDSDPNAGGTLSVTGNSAPGHGSVTMNPDGTFTYTPAAGFSGTDAFTYTVTDSASGRSATGTVTIAVGPVVWYVDDSQSAAGSGTAGAPFNTLSAANTQAGAGSIVFLYQGNAAYTGGVTMQSGEQLLGQPNGLNVNGNQLVAPSGSNPLITNAGGDGVDLAEGADVEGVTIFGTSGNGIAASNVNAAVVGDTTPVSDAGAGGDGLHVTGGAGTLSLGGLSVSGATGHSVSIDGRSGGTATVGGSVSDDGTGISLTSNSGATIDLDGTLSLSTGTHPAFTATGGGTVNVPASASTITTTTGTALDVTTTIGTAGLKFSSVSAGTGGGGPASAITLNGTGGTVEIDGGTIQHTTGTAVSASGVGALTLKGMTIESSGASGTQSDAVSVTSAQNATVDAENDTFSGSTLDGLAVTGTGTGTDTVTARNDTFTNNGRIGIALTDDGSNNSGTAATFTITANTFTGQQATDINLANFGTGTWTGTISGNHIGTSQPGSTTNTTGSVAGFGVNLDQEHGGTITTAVTSNTIYGIGVSNGINGQAGDGSGHLNLTLTSNTIDTQNAKSLDAMTVDSGTVSSDGDTVCLNAAQNTATSEGTQVANGEFDAVGLSLIQQEDGSIFQIQGLPGADVNNDGGVQTFEQGANTLSGPGGPSIAQHLSGGNDFTSAASCPTP